MVTWERTSAMGQTLIMGVIFLLVFSAYYMLQGYASILFGPDLASDALVCLYAVFTAGCFFAPGIVNGFGGKRSLAVGVVGYALFSGAAFAYAALGEPRWTRTLVVCGGAANGLGAAVLWTAQGRILLDAAARDPRHDVGELFAAFWGLFNTSAVLGGFVTFGYFSTQTSSGNAPLYLAFTALIAAGGAACLLLEDDARAAARDRGPALADERAVRAAPTSDGEAVRGPVAELRATLSLFGTKRALCLAAIFWYTGFNQPYQLNGFGDRFFEKRVVGLQLASFYFMEVVGGFAAGAALDNPKRSKRRNAHLVLAQFVAVTALGYGLAGTLEYDAGAEPARVGFRGTSWVVPTVAFAAWGFSDSQVQTYTYWLIGALYPDSPDDRCRMVGFFKLTQSLGWCVGFALLPAKRCAYLTQFALTGACFVVGTLLALLELPDAAAKAPATAAAPLLADAETASLQ